MFLKSSLGIITRSAAVISISLAAVSANAAPISWTDWTSGGNTTAGFEGFGTITTTTSTIDVTYTNPQGVAFFQANGGTDFWQNNRSGRNEATSPFTSDEVDNIPTGTERIGSIKALFNLKSIYQ